MDRDKLKQYISKKEEIEELSYKLKHLGESMVENDTILDYRSGYPVPQSVVGVNSGKYWRRKEQYQKKIAQLKNECAEVEEYIENISDSLTRRIYRMYYLDGITQKKIAKKIHIAQSGVSRRIDKMP